LFQNVAFAPHFFPVGDSSHGKNSNGLERNYENTLSEMRPPQNRPGIDANLYQLLENLEKHQLYLNIQGPFS